MEVAVRSIEVRRGRLGELGFDEVVWGRELEV